ncbi:hypothetical protein COCON_G00098460 [Conger conger]|uniref:Osteopetrosis associated transmembrane protein n=1 Tax=Conger conger TaxID=82655 RepID=A0A9Q1DND2_CONCO|nr:hypothetical protein COCON_G00098460 [Conger conger]
MADVCLLTTDLGGCDGQRRQPPNGTPLFRGPGVQSSFELPDAVPRTLRTSPVSAPVGFRALPVMLSSPLPVTVFVRGTHRRLWAPSHIEAHHPICQNCYIQFGNLKEIYRNISSDQVGPANVSCRDSLLRSDRLMLVFLLYDNLLEIWGWSDCKHCLAVDQHSLTNDTLYYMAILNESLSCFEKHQQQGNHSELCKECKPTYKHLNDLYSRMDVNKTLCIDIEDAMNMTRRLWSKNFNCSFPREETVPVIAVSSFMLFLPIIFYLSSFLHSEQKKRKLIHPKRAKSSNSVANIQDKYS